MRGKNGEKFVSFRTDVDESIARICSVVEASSQSRVKNMPLIHATSGLMAALGFNVSNNNAVVVNKDANWNKKQWRYIRVCCEQLCKMREYDLLRNVVRAILYKAHIDDVSIEDINNFFLTGPIHGKGGM